MNERAAVYTVSVKPQSARGGALPLGDLDGDETSLSGALVAILDGFVEASADGAHVVRVLSTHAAGDDLFAAVQHGQRGVAAEIVAPAGSVRLRQKPADLQLVRCGCLFRLPPAATEGRLAVQTTGVKELFEQGLLERFRGGFPHLTLQLERLAEPDALRQAVAAGAVERLLLVLTEAAGRHSIADTSKWVDGGAAAGIELMIRAADGDGRLDRTLLERYLAGDSAAFAEIVSFAGITFDHAQVGAVLPDGSRRLFDLEHPEAARPVWRVLDGIELDANGEPTDESLAASLGAVIDG